MAEESPRFFVLLFRTDVENPEISPVGRNDRPAPDRIPHAFLRASTKSAKHQKLPPRRAFFYMQAVDPGTMGALAAEPGGGVRNRMKGQTV